MGVYLHDDIFKTVESFVTSRHQIYIEVKLGALRLNLIYTLTSHVQTPLKEIGSPRFVFGSQSSQ